MRDMSGLVITRRHVEDLLPFMRLSDEDRRRLLALPYPASFAVVAERFQALGISAEMLVDRAGGSP
jgi:hypothetical protein